MEKERFEFLPYPAPRSRYGSVQIDEKIFIFGGSGGTKHTYFWNDVYFLDTNNWSWREPFTCKGEIPPARYGHTCNLLDESETLSGNKEVVVFGGKAAAPNDLQNDVHILDLVTFNWRKLEIYGTPPQARYYHSATNVGNGNILIFGGRSRQGEINDISILNTKDRRWENVSISGKAPSKRYHHFAFLTTSQNSERMLYVSGGINRMTSLTDIHSLNLETLKWKKLDIRNESDFYSRANTCTLIARDKLIIVDFGALLHSQIEFLTLGNEEAVNWRTARVEGDLLPTSQFYSIHSFDHRHIFLELNSRICMTLDTNSLEDGFVTFKRQEIGRRFKNLHSDYFEEEHYEEKLNLEVHYASKERFQIFLKGDSTYSELCMHIRKRIQVNHFALLIRDDNRNDYHLLNMEELKEEKVVHRIQQERDKVPVYLVQAVQEEELNKQALTFLAEEIETITHDEHDLPLMQQYDGGSKGEIWQSMSIQVDPMHRDGSAPLPMLFGKPVHLTFVRRLHKKLKQLEVKGMSAFMKENEPEGVSLLKERRKHSRAVFSFGTFCWNLLWFLALPITWLYTLCSFKYTLKGKLLVSFGCSLFFCCLVTAAFCIKLGIHHVIGSGIALCPLFIVTLFGIMFCILISYPTNQVGKLSTDLAPYKVNIYQRLVNGHYGRREATAEDVVCAIASKEERDKDSSLYFFMCYVFSVVASVFHTLVTFFFLYREGKLEFHDGWDVHILALAIVILNFITILLFLFSLALALCIYARQRTLITYFGMLAVPEYAKASELPILLLDSPANIMAWIKIRQFIKGHQFLPLRFASVTLGWSFLVGVALWVTLVIKIFSSKNIVDVFTILILYDTFLMSIYIVFTFSIGAKINAWKDKNILSLYKEQIKLELELSKLRMESKSDRSVKKGQHMSQRRSQLKEEVESCVSLIESAGKLIKKQDAAFHVLGFSISEGISKVAVGFLVSTTVAVSARLGLDMGNLEGIVD